MHRQENYTHPRNSYAQIALDTVIGKIEKEKEKKKASVTKIMITMHLKVIICIINLKYNNFAIWYLFIYGLITISLLRYTFKNLFHVVYFMTLTFHVVCFLKYFSLVIRKFDNMIRSGSGATTLCIILCTTRSCDKLWLVKRVTRSAHV